MEIPEYSELIDDNTLAFYTFNENIDDMCGRYPLKEYNSKYQVSYVDEGEINSLCNGAICNHYLANRLRNTSFTLDFCIKIVDSKFEPTDIFTFSSGCTPNSTEIKIKDDKLIIGTIYQTSLEVSIDKYMDNKYHHFMITKSKNEYVEVYIDGLLMDGNNLIFNNIISSYWDNFKINLTSDGSPISLFNVRISNTIPFYPSEIIGPYMIH